MPGIADLDARMGAAQLGNDMLLDSEYVDEKQDVAIISPDDTMDDAEPEPELRAEDFESMKKRYLPEIPDLETDAEAVHTWDIQRWRNLSRREHGPVFQCGGHPWRILFFPQGNNVEFASFYLEHGYEEKPPEDWYACVQFMLVLWNPNDPTIYVQHTATHRFTAEEGDWGFTRFSELRRLFNVPWDDKDRPLVEGDSAKVTAYVRVVKDPTGVLWHNFINYDSKKETGMVGLRNQGATCYLNSLLQSLYLTHAFRKAVYQIPTENDGDFRSNSAYALQRLFYQLQTSNVAVATNELTAAFGWDSRQTFEQQDVQELSRILMERLEVKMKGTEAEDALPKMFVGKMKTYISCINVDYESSRIEDYWDIQLNVSGCKNLDDSFKDYIQVETMDGENKYFAEGFGLQDAKKGVIFQSFPNVLHLQLKRFEYDFNRDAMMKINDRYEFPEVWDASPYLSEDADRSEPYIYRLHSVLVHSGDLNAGHYYAFIKPKKDAEFYKFDDDRVTRATKREALEENFGGEYTNVPNGHLQRNPYTRQYSRLRSMNAYMLVYVRESRIDNILMSDDDVEPPQHLAKKFAEERAIIEKRRKEREEAHLYMEVQVATNENFSTYEGFDIVNWKEVDTPSAPKTFRVLRATTLGEFKSSLAGTIGADPEMLRPWVMVNRQNQTVRPDQPLMFNDMTVEEAANKFGTRTANFRLWMELAQGKDAEGKPIWGESQVDLHGIPNNKAIFLFLKYFDIETQALRGIGQFWASWQDKVADISPQVLKLMGWPAGTGFRCFEEIKSGMIETMKPKVTLATSELQDGDIITVHKTYSDKDLTSFQAAGHIVDVREFYDYILNRIRVQFLPKFETIAEDAVFDLELSKKMTYDQFAAKVGDHLKVDPTHLRFSPINATTGKARPVVRRQTNQTLHQILNPPYSTYSNTTNQRNDALYYEILELSLSELETRRSIKINWLSDGISKEELYEILVPKNAIVEDLIASLKRKANLNDEAAQRIRVYEAHANKVYKVVAPSYSVAGITDFVTLYAECIPEEEAQATEADDLVSAFHFDKEPSKPHGVPFIFLVKNGEVFKDTKERLSKRTGIKGKQFEKIKFAVVSKSSYSKPDYLNDEDILSEKLVSKDDLLGLDHFNKNRSNGKSENIFIR